jgi:xanthine dehydrogenase accessory factor
MLGGGRGWYDRSTSNMRDLLPEIDRWLTQGQSVALATVLETWGSGPRRAGSKLALVAGGEQAGSLGEGGAESEVRSRTLEVLESGQPLHLNLKVEDETAWTAGLPCGGRLELWLERLDPAWFAPLAGALAEEQPVAVLTIVRGPTELFGRKAIAREGGWVSGAPSGLKETALEAARQALARGRSTRMVLDSASSTEPVEAFIDVLMPSPTLIVVGGVPIALALCALAKTLGFRTVLIDPAAPESAARAGPLDRLLSSWPAGADAPLRMTAGTAVAVLTQNPALDEPVLKQALAGPAFYVGALGGRPAQTRRRQRLLEAGLDPDRIARMHAPIGLDLGSRAPAEVALGVLSQIIAARNGASV